MIYGIGYIDPSKRYEPIPGWYKKCVIFHSKKYHKILETMVVPSDTICVDAGTGCTETHKKIIENYFKGSRVFINIGAAGSNRRDLQIGDVVDANTVYATAGLAKYFTDEPVLSSPTFSSYPTATVQCVPTLYYARGVLEKSVDCVEQESEAVAATCMWLNRNYGDRLGGCKYANIFYISDTIDQDGRPWKDTLKMYEHKRDVYRRKVLEIALDIS